MSGPEKIYPIPGGECITDDPKKAAILRNVLTGNYWELRIEPDGQAILHTPHGEEPIALTPQVGDRITGTVVGGTLSIQHNGQPIRPEHTE